MKATLRAMVIGVSVAVIVSCTASNQVQSAGPLVAAGTVANKSGASPVAGDQLRTAQSTHAAMLQGKRSEAQESSPAPHPSRSGGSTPEREPRLPASMGIHSQQPAIAEAPFGPVSVTAVNFAQSPPLSVVAKEADKNRGRDHVARAALENERVRKPSSSPLAQIPQRDTVLQTSTSNAMPAPIVNVEGISSADNLNINSFEVLPPDTNGSVGPNHYVQFVNDLMRVYDKSGNPLTPPFRVSQLFANLNGICATDDDGDGIILYDPLADRWLVSQLGFNGSLTPPFHECVAISMTSDPTAGYYLYDFVTPGTEFPDYPHLGVWPDGYYMTVNQFLADADGTGAYAFDRAKMLVGDPTASLIYFNLNLAAHPERPVGPRHLCSTSLLDKRSSW